MSPYKTQKLLNRFPKIYSGYYLPEETSLMSRGFQCKDGWFELVWKMSEEIETLSDLKCIPTPVMSEIKEKMGGLRARLICNDDIINEAVREYEQQSLNVCELCGNNGVLRRISIGLVGVRCNEHSQGSELIDLKKHEMQTEIIKNAYEFQDGLLAKCDELYEQYGYITIALIHEKLFVSNKTASSILVEYNRGKR